LGVLRQTDVQKSFTSDVTFDKIQDGGGRHFKIVFIGLNAVTAAHFRTKFGTRTENNFLDIISAFIFYF